MGDRAHVKTGKSKGITCTGVKNVSTHTLHQSALKHVLQSCSRLIRHLASMTSWRQQLQLCCRISTDVATPAITRHRASSIVTSLRADEASGKTINKKKRKRYTFKNVFCAHTALFRCKNWNINTWFVCLFVCYRISTCRDVTNCCAVELPLTSQPLPLHLTVPRRSCRRKKYTVFAMYLFFGVKSIVLYFEFTCL